MRLYPALELLVLTQVLILVWALTRARFTDALLVSMVHAVFAVNFVFVGVDPMRPEMELTVAWLGGLVTLECGRRAGWHRGVVCCGAFLLSYAAGLHYFALPALVGLCVFAVAALIELERRESLLAIAAMVGGSLLFVGPYLALFVLPEFRGIMDVVNGLDAYTRSLTPSASWLQPLWVHRLVYADMYRSAVGGSIYTAPVTLAVRLGVPAVILSTPILIYFRETRTIALAALPFQLALVLAFKHTLPGYVRGELTMLYVATLLLLIAGIDGGFARLGKPAWRRWVCPTAAALLLLLAINATKPWRLWTGPRFVDEIAVARAAGQSILGSEAVVAGRSICLWFTSGARYYRNVTNELLYPPDVSSVNPAVFFSPFDAVAEEGSASWVTYNRQHVSLPSWYISGALQLRGFYASRDPSSSGPGYYLSSATRPSTLVAYYWEHGSLKRFRERSGGRTAVTAVVHGSEWLPDSVPAFREVLRIPLPPGRFETLGFFVGDPGAVEAFRRKGLAVRDVFEGDSSTIDANSLAASVDYRRDVANIFYNNSELFAVTAQAVEPRDTRLLSFAPSQPGDLNGGVGVHKDDVRSNQLLSSYPVNLSAGQWRLAVDLETTRGAIVLGLLDDRGRTIGQLYRNHSQRSTREQLAFSVPVPTAIRLVVWANNATESRVDMTISDSLVERIHLERGAVADLASAK
jgi:hypothetical protein